MTYLWVWKPSTRKLWRLMRSTHNHHCFYHTDWVGDTHTFDIRTAGAALLRYFGGNTATVRWWVSETPPEVCDAHVNP